MLPCSYPSTERPPGMPPPTRRAPPRRPVPRSADCLPLAQGQVAEHDAGGEQADRQPQAGVVPVDERLGRVAPERSALPSLDRSTAPTTVTPSRPATSRDALSSADATPACDGGRAVDHRVGQRHVHQAGARGRTARTRAAGQLNVAPAPSRANSTRPDGHDRHAERHRAVRRRAAPPPAATAWRRAPGTAPSARTPVPPWWARTRGCSAGRAR